MPTNASTAHTHHPAVPADCFESEARAIVQGVRSSLIAVLRAFDVDPRRPQTLAHRFGLDKNLAWRISRVITDEHLLASIHHLPGRSSQRTLLEAFAQAGAAPASVQSVRDAIAAFDQMVVTQAGDRDTWEKMVASLAGAAQAERDEAYRKLAFEGNTAIWGIEAKARYGAQMLAPSTKPGHVDLVSVNSLVDYRRLRSNVRWPIVHVRYRNDDGSPKKLELPEPIDARLTDPQSPPLMLDFCTSNLPAMRLTCAVPGQTRYEALGGQVGNASRCTCTTGWIARGLFPAYAGPNDRSAEHALYVNTPVQVVNYDFFVHHALPWAMNLSRHIMSMLPGEPAYPAEDPGRQELHVVEKITDMGIGPFELHAPELPDYAKMLAIAFERFGHRASDFRCFRFRLNYPVIGTAVVLRFPLPEAPLAG